MRAQRGHEAALLRAWLAEEARLAQVTGDDHAERQDAEAEQPR
jgi:hypothetical protein